MLVCAHAYAGPEGGTVVGGDGSISQSGLETTVVQQTDRLAIDWQSFNVDADERVQFIQPSSDSIALNRVLGNDASHIFGQLDANGQVILVNPNGVLFGEGASVNVGGLVASGLHIESSDFLNGGDFTFKAKGNRDGFVINQGIINAATGGNVALIGKQVVNEGLISARLGSVALAAGREAVLTFDQQGLLGVRVTKETLQRKLGIEPALVNSGTIEAPGSRVLLTAAVSQDVFSQAVNHGDLAGDTDVLVHADGSFTLGKGANLVNSGEIDVSNSVGEDPAFGEGELVESAGAVVLLAGDIRHSGNILADSFSTDVDAGEVALAASGRTWVQGGDISAYAYPNPRFEIGADGGNVTLLGKQVGLTDGATVSVGGVYGGAVTIGGEGSNLPSGLSDTDYALVGKDVLVRAEGSLDPGSSGGEINVWSKVATLVEGHLDVSSAGRATLASEGTLGYTGTIDLSGGPSGGLLTLAAEDLHVTKEESFFSVSEAALNDALASGRVALKATSDIAVGTESQGVFITSMGSLISPELTLSAGGDVTVTNSHMHVAGTLSLTAGGGIAVVDSMLAPSETLVLNAGQTISTLGALIESETVSATAGDDIYLPLSEQVASATVNAGNVVRLDLASEDYRPHLSVSGNDVSINSFQGFTGEITAAELTLNNDILSGEGIDAQVNVSGTTHIAGAGRFSLRGDLNILTADAEQYYPIITITEQNDLLLGDMNFSDPDVSITSVGGGATIRQLPNSSINIGAGEFYLKADNIELGAGGTSQVRIYSGALGLDFGDTLGLDLSLADFQDPVTTSLHITGSDEDNTVNIGQYFALPAYEYADELEPGMQHQIHFGEGNDTVNLASDLVSPFSLGGGNDVINLLAPDLAFNPIDFDSNEDTINYYTP